MRQRGRSRARQTGLQLVAGLAWLPAPRTRTTAACTLPHRRPARSRADLQARRRRMWPCCSLHGQAVWWSRPPGSPVWQHQEPRCGMSRGFPQRGRKHRRRAPRAARPGRRQARWAACPRAPRPRCSPSEPPTAGAPRVRAPGGFRALPPPLLAAVAERGTGAQLRLYPHLAALR